MRYQISDMRYEGYNNNGDSGGTELWRNRFSYHSALAVAGTKKRRPKPKVVGKKTSRVGNQMFRPYPPTFLQKTVKVRPQINYSSNVRVST